MTVQVTPNGVEPVGDDQKWKREETRVNNDLIAAITELQSQVAALQERVN